MIESFRERANRIKTVKDAGEYLDENGMCEDLIEEYNNAPVDSYSEKLCEYRIVVAALTNNEQRHLTKGDRYFPVVQFCHPDKVNNCLGNIMIGHIEHDGTRYAVVGGLAHIGAYAGLGSFDSTDGVSHSSSTVGFRSVSSKEIAQYISNQFGRLLFEVHYGGLNCDWRWVE